MDRLLNTLSSFRPVHRPALDFLSRAERKVLAAVLLHKSATNKVIAMSLNLSEHRYAITSPLSTATWYPSPHGAVALRGAAHRFAIILSTALRLRYTPPS